MHGAVIRLVELHFEDLVLHVGAELAEREIHAQFGVVMHAQPERDARLEGTHVDEVYSRTPDSSETERGSPGNAEILNSTTFRNKTVTQRVASLTIVCWSSYIESNFVSQT